MLISFVSSTVSLIKFSYFEKATPFLPIFNFYLTLFNCVKLKVEYGPNFSGLLRISKLYQTKFLLKINYSILQIKHILSSKTDATPYIQNEIESENERIPTYSLDKIGPRQNRAENTKELQTRKVLKYGFFKKSFL